MTILVAKRLPLRVEARVDGDRLALAIELRNDTAAPVHPLWLDPTGTAPWFRVQATGDDGVVVGAGRFRPAPWAAATAMPAWPTARALAAGEAVQIHLTRALPLVEDGLVPWGEHDPQTFPTSLRARIVVAVECVTAVRGRAVRLPSGAEQVAGAAKRVELAIGETTSSQSIAMHVTPLLWTPLGDPPHAALDAWLPEPLRRSAH